MKKASRVSSAVRRLFSVICVACIALVNVAIAGCSEKTVKAQGEMTTKQATKETRFMGGLSPAAAVEYMKSTPNVCIIDVREPEWYDGYTQFEGNKHIPYSQLKKRYKEIPADRPVILNCGAGIMAPRAYNLLQELGVEVMQLYYIDGSPRFDEYNEWVAKQKR